MRKRHVQDHDWRIQTMFPLCHEPPGQKPHILLTNKIFLSEHARNIFFKKKKSESQMRRGFRTKRQASAGSAKRDGFVHTAKQRHNREAPLSLVPIRH